MESPRLGKLGSHQLCDTDWILLNLEVSVSKVMPASFGEFRLLAPVAGDVPLDLLVPVARPAVGLPFARVAMPEGAVDEDGESPACKGNVDTAAGGGDDKAQRFQPPEEQMSLRSGVGKSCRIRG